MTLFTEAIEKLLLLVIDHSHLSHMSCWPFTILGDPSRRMAGTLIF